MKGFFKKSFIVVSIALLLAIGGLGIALVLPSGIVSAESSFKDRNIVYNSVDKEIVVSENKVLDITETITVTFYRSGVNLGLSRNVSRINKITTFYKGKKYVKTTVNKFKLLGVTLDGEDEYNFVEKKGDYFYINTGADGDYKDAGQHVYVIHYLLDMGEDLIKQFDSFTFDVMDYGFMSRVEKFSARITLPKEFLPEGQELKDVLSFRTNQMEPLGLEAANCSVEGNTISCDAIINGSQIGLTMQLLLPQGYFKTYYAPNGMFWFVFSMLWIVAAAITGIFLFARLRKRQKMVIVPEFYPPKWLNALEVASAYRGRIKSKDFASLVISWAAQGFVEIEFKEKKKLVLTRLKGEPTNSDERKFFLELFGGSQRVVVDKKLKTKVELSKAANKLYKLNENKGLMNWRFQLVNAILTFLPLFLYIFWSATIFGSSVYIAIFLMIFVIVGTCVFFYVPVIPIWFKLIWCGGFAGAPLGVMIATMLPTDYDTIGLVYMILAVMFAGNFANRFLSVRNFTDKELAVRPQILGFKQFLVTAELDRLEMLLKDNPNYYYDILPYCYIFGITKQMEEKFKLLHIENPKWAAGYSVYGACGAIGHSFSHSVGGVSSSSGGHGGGGGGHGGSSGGGGGGGGSRGR